MLCCRWLVRRLTVTLDERASVVNLLVFGGGVNESIAQRQPGSMLKPLHEMEHPRTFLLFGRFLPVLDLDQTG